MSFSGKLSSPHKSTLVIDGKPVPVTLKPHARARRIILRMTPDQTGVVLTVPENVAREKAMEFAASQAGWIWRHLQTAPQRIPFEIGNVIPLRGIPHRLTPMAGKRGTITAWQPPAGMAELRLPMAAEHHKRRLTDWLKSQAKKDFSQRSSHYAEAMQTRYKRITIRDQDSRWGSCSSNRTLSYSWRLILAPGDVLDYIAAHEVAHLIEMNHSENFWKLVYDHCPHTDWARKWLKTKGRQLKRYG